MKDNPKELPEQVQSLFNNQKTEDMDEVAGKGHGRMEIPQRHRQNNRLARHGQKQETEVRYHISSAKDAAETFNANIRRHWGVENKLLCRLVKI